MSRRKFTDRDALELEARGLSAREMAARFECAQRTVERWRRAQGLPVASPGGPRVTSERLSEAAMLLADGVSHREVARTLQMSCETLRAHFPGTGWSPQQSGAFARMLRGAR